MGVGVTLKKSGIRWAGGEAETTARQSVSDACLAGAGKEEACDDGSA